MAKALPYLGGQRLCLPVKCVLLFDFDRIAPSVRVVFTDNEEEKITWESNYHPDWVIASQGAENLLDTVTERLRQAGYEMTVRNHLPNCVSFNLEPQ